MRIFESTVIIEYIESRSRQQFYNAPILMLPKASFLCSLFAAVVSHGLNFNSKANEAPYYASSHK